jgi:hypothetical protein
MKKTKKLAYFGFTFLMIGAAFVFWGLSAIHPAVARVALGLYFYAIGKQLCEGVKSQKSKVESPDL